MQKRGGQFDKVDYNLLPIASVTQGRFRNAGPLELRRLFSLPCCIQRRKKGFSFRMKAWNGVKGFLGEWDLLQNISSEEFYIESIGDEIAFEQESARIPVHI
jgi:hypothetical protein